MLLAVALFMLLLENNPDLAQKFVLSTRTSNDLQLMFLLPTRGVRSFFPTRQDTGMVINTLQHGQVTLVHLHKRFKFAYYMSPPCHFADANVLDVHYLA